MSVKEHLFNWRITKVLSKALTCTLSSISAPSTRSTLITYTPKLGNWMLTPALVIQIRHKYMFDLPLTKYLYPL